MSKEINDELLNQVFELNKIRSILCAIEKLAEDDNEHIYNLAGCAKKICSEAGTALYSLSDNLDAPEPPSD